MGELAVQKTIDEQSVRSFMQAILTDVHALELMVQRGVIESGVRRVGTEQEMYLVDQQSLAAPIAEQMMERLKTDHRFQYEVARFNLEANLDVQTLGGSVLRDLEHGLDDVLTTARAAAQDIDCDVLVTGILPTLRQRDVTATNLTPLDRYKLLDSSSIAAQGGAIKLSIDGLEHFESKFDTVVIEGANTSMQLHYQVAADESARLYNLAQFITAPLLAAATNSPLLLGKRVWCETRVAVFERAFDDRSASQLSRGVPTRVGFGSSWIKESLLELFRDNVARYQIVITRELSEDPLEVLEQGNIPRLQALQLHNGTVWRWNRPCYGITDGVPHLRIENRVLPGGPTILDEVANAALFYGLMIRADEEYGEVREKLPFEDAKANFLASARNGLDVTYHWLDGKRIGVRDLLLKELIPLAREGLASIRVPDEDLNRYLGVIEERIQVGRTGATWLLENLAGVSEQERWPVAQSAVQAMLERQQGAEPVHTWQPIVPTQSVACALPAKTLGDIMTTDVFTLRPDDVVELATSVMSWKHIRHVPVEDAEGKLVGLLTAREMLGLKLSAGSNGEPPSVQDLMNPAPTTVAPELSIEEGMARLLENNTGCLLVVRHGLLVGIVTERDLVRTAYEVLNREDSP